MWLEKIEKELIGLNYNKKSWEKSWIVGDIGLHKTLFQLITLLNIKNNIIINRLN